MSIDHIETFCASLKTDSCKDADDDLVPSIPFLLFIRFPSVNGRAKLNLMVFYSINSHKLFIDAVIFKENIFFFDNLITELFIHANNIIETFIICGLENMYKNFVCSKKTKTN